MARTFRMTITGILALLRDGDGYTVVVPDTLLGSEVGESRPKKKKALDGELLKRHSPQLILGGVLPGLLLRGHRIQFRGLPQGSHVERDKSMDQVPNMGTLAGTSRGCFDPDVLSIDRIDEGSLSAIMEIDCGKLSAGESDEVEWKIEALPSTGQDTGVPIVGQLATSLVWEVELPPFATVLMSLTHLKTGIALPPIPLPSKWEGHRLSLTNACADSNCGTHEESDDDFRWYYSFLKKDVRKDLEEYYKDRKNQKKKLPVPTRASKLTQKMNARVTIEGQNCRPCEFCI